MDLILYVSVSSLVTVLEFNRSGEIIRDLITKEMMFEYTEDSGFQCKKGV